MDQSVQPGDGGWGVMVEGQAFWRVKRTFLFASGSYLVNPKETNDTPSIIAILGLPTNTGQFAGLSVNSVPDQYLARAGGTVHVWKGFSATLAWRVEGLKSYDLFGQSFGWRRPGTEMFIEPGVRTRCRSTCRSATTTTATPIRTLGLRVTRPSRGRSS